MTPGLVGDLEVDLKTKSKRGDIPLDMIWPNGSPWKTACRSKTISHNPLPYPNVVYRMKFINLQKLRC